MPEPEVYNNNSGAFHKESYERHADWYNQLFPSDEDKRTRLIAHESAPRNNINKWLQNIFFSCIDPLLTKNKKWLTVGDAYGHDANYIASAGIKDVVASDLSSDFLKISYEEGIINRYSSQNAEKLSYNDSEFDYILCKESYHHFPRPYAALYEMIRVAKNAIVIIEPQDPISKMPALLGMVNILSAINPKFIEKIWKNRFSYEKVGNYVYKVSEREFEKFAAGLGLPLVAFKKINPNFWYSGIEQYEAVPQEKRFRKIQLKKNILDFLVELGVISSQVLSTVIFKEVPDCEIIDLMKRSGYKFVNIPENPYASKNS
jgi:ubiquinone/menaquinone biosynthesis C-methylase UbiE